MTCIDIHVHTTASACSIFSPRQLVVAAEQMGVPAVVTTNHHDSYGDADFLRVELGRRGILYFPAIEITNQWGDFLLYGEDLDRFQGCSGRFPTEFLPDEDIAVVWAHPFRFMSEKEVESIQFEVANYIDAVEGINGNCMFMGGWANRRAFKMADEIKKPVVAGSDAHAPDMFFLASTKFLEPINSYKDMVRCLKNGNVGPGAGG